MTQKYEVVFETKLYYSVFVDAEDEQEASEKAIDNRFPPKISVPTGFEIADDETDWFIDGVVEVSYDD